MNSTLSRTNGKAATAVVELSASEMTRLECLEGWIEDALNEFVHIGHSLLEIRDEKFYRATHKTFELYSKERWGFTRMRAHQLIVASGVVENVNNCLQKPINEAQARELAKAPAEDQAAIWDQAVEACGKDVTAAKVREAVEAWLEEDEPLAMEVAEEEPTAEETVEAMEDAVGQEVPEALFAIFEKAKEFEAQARVLVTVEQWAKEIETDPAGKWLHVQSLVADIKNAKRALRYSAPYAVCVYCGGQDKKCDACKQRRFIHKLIYKAAPAELRL